MFQEIRPHRLTPAGFTHQAENQHFESQQIRWDAWKVKNKGGQNKNLMAT